jgi:RNA polymerase sigma factor (TIGR02999 family)
MINEPEREQDERDSSRRDTVTRLLAELRDGRRAALEELFPLVYDELRELAHHQRRAWHGEETLNTTALVHEAYLRLVNRRGAWDSETHFLAASARAIRHILINYARDRHARKRGGDWKRVSLAEGELAGEAAATTPPWEDRVLALDEALKQLSLRSERQGRIVECRFFGGMTVEQTATALGLSTPTVVRGWAMAQAWLRRALAA